MATAVEANLIQRASSHSTRVPTTRSAAPRKPMDANPAPSRPTAPLALPAAAPRLQTLESAGHAHEAQPSPIPAATTASDSRTIVTPRRRRSVSHRGRRTASHARRPPAAPTAMAAVVMHWAHTPASITASPSA